MRSLSWIVGLAYDILCVLLRCNDLVMQLAIYLRGPIGVGYTVYQDFKYYKSGIYYHYGRSLSVSYTCFIITISAFF